MQLVRIPGYGLTTHQESQGDVSDVLLNNFGLTQGSYWLDDRGYEIAVRLRLPGGKGGFGSNLRAQGNKMSSKKRSGGYEACRDLSGNRLRTLNQSRLIQEYLKREPEIEQKREAEIRDKMLKAIEQADRKPIFTDSSYLKTSREVVDSVQSAVFAAILGSDSASESSAEEDSAPASAVLDAEDGESKGKTVILE